MSNFLSTSSSAFDFCSFSSSSSMNASRSSSRTSISNSAQIFLITSTSISWFNVAIIPLSIKNLTISAGVRWILSESSLIVIAWVTTSCVIASTLSSLCERFLWCCAAAFSNEILSCSSFLELKSFVFFLFVPTSVRFLVFDLLSYISCGIMRLSIGFLSPCSRLSGRCSLDWLERLSNGRCGLSGRSGLSPRGANLFWAPSRWGYLLPSVIGLLGYGRRSPRSGRSVRSGRAFSVPCGFGTARRTISNLFTTGFGFTTSTRGAAVSGSGFFSTFSSGFSSTSAFAFLTTKAFGFFATTCDPWLINSFRRLIWSGVTVLEWVLPVIPICVYFSTISLLVIPSSFANSFILIGVSKLINYFSFQILRESCAQCLLEFIFFKCGFNTRNIIAKICWSAKYFCIVIDNDVAGGWLFGDFY